MNPSFTQDHDPSADKTEALQLIHDFVIECRGNGAFLPPSDLEIIVSWVSACPSMDRLMLLLEDLLPAYFSKPNNSNVPRSLRGVNRRVCKKIQAIHSTNALDRN